jgi:hypothetical protein
MALVWHDSFINPAAGVTPVSSKDVGSLNIAPEIGITSTPVIDPSTNTLYVVAMTKEVGRRSVSYVERLHALDLATGQEKFGGPATIAPMTRGTGAGSRRGRIGFNALRQVQRAGLLLVNGTVYAGFASFDDIPPYHGWLVGYDARTLRQVSVFNTTPFGKQGGIWMSGGGPASDAAGNIFLAIGNGTFETRGRPRDFGNSVVKLSPARGLAVVDYFTPTNQAFLNAKDFDLGSGGVLLLPDQAAPGRHLLVSGGKSGELFLLDRDNLGRFSRAGNVVVQEIPGVTPLFSTPAYFNGRIYVVGTPYQRSTARESLRAYSFTGGRISTPPASGRFTYGYPGASPSISADGTTNGIVWTLDNGAYASGGPAILRAYDAASVTEIYDSTQAGPRDQAGPAVKFAVPTVVNGRVYVGGDGTLTVYGLLGT